MTTSPNPLLFTPGLQDLGFPPGIEPRAPGVKDIAGWGNRGAITGWGPWGVTPPLQTFQWIIGDLVQ